MRFEGISNSSPERKPNADQDRRLRMHKIDFDGTLPLSSGKSNRHKILSKTRLTTWRRGNILNKVLVGVPLAILKTKTYFVKKQ